MRWFSRLPPDMEAAVYRETAGETVKWTGRSSGETERGQGWIMMGAGGVVALANLAPALLAISALLGWIFGGGKLTSDDVSAISGLFFFAAGVGLAVFGWRLQASAERVVWAVTNIRLWRIVANGVTGPRIVQSWTRGEILNVKRITWRSGQQALQITVRQRGGDEDPTYYIVGPSDLDAATEALLAMD
ncbi:MAG: hypothetical protein AAF869_02845 [Pseudomonadota bacterium]